MTDTTPFINYKKEYERDSIPNLSHIYMLLPNTTYGIVIL